MSRTALSWGRRLAPVIVLAILVWRLGASPFIAGVRDVSGGAVAAAAGLVLLTTVGSAWRWKIVAGGLGLDLPLTAAVTAYYRAIFLNVTLPGGVLGDVHRGIRHGRQVGDVGGALRSVVWERCAGQAVQVLLTLGVLLALPSPVHAYMPWIAAGLGAVAFVLLLLARVRPDSARSAWARLGTPAGWDVRGGLSARRAWPRIAFASLLVVAGHAAVFLLAARTAGVRAPLSEMLPITLLVLAGTVLPSVAGWGPREGVTAWAFGAAGLGAQRGVATAVVYGVMVLVASLPGAVVLVTAWFRGDRPSVRAQPPVPGRTAHA